MLPLGKGGSGKLGSGLFILSIFDCILVFLPLCVFKVSYIRGLFIKYLGELGTHRLYDPHVRGIERGRGRF